VRKPGFEVHPVFGIPSALRSAPQLTAVALEKVVHRFYANADGGQWADFIHVSEREVRLAGLLDDPADEGIVTALEIG